MLADMSQSYEVLKRKYESVPGFVNLMIILAQLTILLV